MIKELFKLIDKIEKQRQFDVCRTTETAFREMLDFSFEIYGDMPTAQNAKGIYDSIEDAARVGRILLAREYTKKFEDEIGYGIFAQN